MYFKLIGQFEKKLGQLDKWLAQAQEFATARAFDSSAFLGLRLAPDQFVFARQVQATCDTAKLAASRLSGREAPTHADDEQSIEQLRARVASVIQYLRAFSAKDFEAAATRTVSQPRWEGKSMNGEDYFLEHAQPNFYFHLTHSYAILRHAGVNLGKKDYLGALSLR